MFSSLGWGEVAVLLVLGLFVFGPERLPGMAADAGKTLRKVRLYVKGMSEDLKSELGPELGDVDLRSLHPRTFVQKHLFSDDDDDEPAAPMPRGGVSLRKDEPAPWDPDAT
ncbi:MAG: sec-independent translocase [Actinomycetota bacterium]|nr:sec-independent translocase [Actinomycetota bacterium]